MADEELGGTTATIEAPAAEPAAAAPAEETKLNPGDVQVEIAGEKVVVEGLETVDRVRDAHGRFAKSTTTEEAKPAEAPAAPFVPDKTLVERAFKSGLTPYEAARLGDKLEGELARMEAAATAASTTTTTVNPATAGAAAPAATPAQQINPDVAAHLAKLAEYDPSLHELLAPILQRNAAQESPEVKALQDKVRGLEQTLHQEQERLRAEAAHAKSVELDKVFAKLPEDYRPALGKGDVNALANTPYFRTRGEVYRLTELAEQFHPDLPLQDRAMLALNFRFPEIHKQHSQREAYEAALESAKQRGHSGGGSSTPNPNAPHNGPLSESPAIQAMVAEFDRQNALNGR